MQKPPDTLVERLQRYCVAKAGVVPSITFGARQPSYHILGGFLQHFANFFLDEVPVRLKLRCKINGLEALHDKASIRVSKDMHWEGTGWKWADIRIDGKLSEAELIKLLDDSHQICMEELSEHDIKLTQIADPGLTMSEAIHALIDLNNLTVRREEIESLLQPAILLNTRPSEETQMSLGQSKIGGLPDLPDDWVYPNFDGKPLAFLAQINLGEIPPHLPKAPLPSIGILYFFSVFGWQQDNGDRHRDLPWERSGESDFSQVLYFDGASSSLKRRSKPSGIKTFKAAAVRFVEVLSVPYASDYARDPVLKNLDWSEEEFEQFTQLDFDFGFVLSRLIGSTPQHKLLGYPVPIQSEVTQTNTRLLCQIDSDYHHLDTDMMWGDGGIIYFTIPQSDLDKGNFATIYSDCQFG